MKRILNFAAASALSALCSCSGSLAPESDGAVCGNPENVVFSVKTNTASSSGESGVFMTGDEIGLFVTARTDNASPVLPDKDNCVGYNLRLVLKDTGWGPADESNVITWDESGKVYDFYAYYPYKEGLADPADLFFSVSAEQDAEENHHASDFMVAVNLDGRTNTKVELQFSHLLSLVEVELDTDRTDINVGNVESAVTGCNVNVPGMSVSVPADQSLEKVRMFKKDNNHFYAVLPPQTFETGSRLFSFSIGDDFWAVSCAQTLTLTPGSASRHKVVLREEQPMRIIHYTDAAN